MAPRIEFSIEQIRNKARKDLLYLLEGVRGKKNVILDQSLVGPIGTIVKVAVLQEYGVDKFFILENDNADTSQRNVVFISRGECGRHAESIAAQIKRIQRESQTGHDFHIFWVPRRTLVSDKLLEEAGVLGDVNIAELPLSFFPLEKDVLSLELDGSFRDLYLSKDVTPNFLMAKALMEIQQNHGLFPRVIGKGDNAKRVADLLSRMRQELLAGEDTAEANKIGLTPSTTNESVVIIDREVDFVTPLLTQLTYEGLIDEVFEIHNNQTKVDTTVVGAPAQASTATSQSRKRTVQLDSSDKLYEQLRDANFAIVGSLLNKVARRLQKVQSDYETKQKSKTIAELKDFVSQLPGYQQEQQSVKIHTGLAEEIIKHTRTDQFKGLLEVQQNLAAGADPSGQFDGIEELIARDAPIAQTLRLLCIYSCISGGIRPKEFDQFRRLILQGYGYQHLLTLNNLEKLQLFLSKSSPLAGMIPIPGNTASITGNKTNYTYLRKQLRLIVDEVQEDDPNDVSYVYSGYAPLSIRLVQCILQKQYLLSVTKGNSASAAGAPAGVGTQGWQGFDEAVKHVRGQTFYEHQKGEDKAVKARALLSGSGNKQTVFVVFVGGITFTEIAALRFIAKQEEGRRNIVICTTSIINGNKMMEAAVEKASDLSNLATDQYLKRASETNATMGTDFGQSFRKGIGIRKVEIDEKSVLDSLPPSGTIFMSNGPGRISPPITPDVVSGSPSRQTSTESASEIAPEIIVWTEDMDIDNASPVESDDDLSSLNSDIEEEAPRFNDDPASLQTSTADKTTGCLPSASPNLTELSDLSSIPSTVSSKATTPTPVEAEGAQDRDQDQITDEQPQSHQQSPSHDAERYNFSIRPKASIPTDISPYKYASECITAAESCRLNPYALHPEEYHLLRHHLSYTQVTTYLNIRNGILRLWLKHPWIGVTRIEAVGCANARWFDAASVCYDWLVRRGYINYGCVQVSGATTDDSVAPVVRRQKTIAVIGAGISGLSCARQLEERGEPPPRVVVLEGRSRVGGRVYSREFQTKPKEPVPAFQGKRHTAEMGGMIITGFDRGNPINILLRGQLSLPYHALTADTTIYDSNGKALYNDCLDRVSEYKHKSQPAKLIEGRRDLIEEGRDSPGDGSKTMYQEEATFAAQPDAPAVSEQNIPDKVNLVPVSSDKLTGRVHVEPGTPATTKASDKAKLMGWTIRDSADGENIDLTSAVNEEGATLGSVLNSAISQYKQIVGLNAQDHRLINWHIANLEYSNATSLHNLSLPLWDIDAGNEWEGSHTMVVGGYQSVARGLALCPTPLDLKTKFPVKSISYHTGDGMASAAIECEDGSVVDADAVNNVVFNPPLPSWKTDVVERLGFGILNKVVLVYDKIFWDHDRHIFGVLRESSNRHSTSQKDYAANRGRFFQWFNVSNTTGLPCLIALMAGEAGFETEHSSNDSLVAEATEVLRSVFGQDVPYPVEAMVTRWGSDRFARGSYSSAAPGMQPEDYDIMARPVGNLFFAGEHTIGTHPATVHGAYLSGLRAASEVLETLVGPIEVPTPLILPRDSVLLRKPRLQAYEQEIQAHIQAKLGERPSRPGKVAGNAYILYSKDLFDIARKKCEENRKPGKGGRAMWKDATAEERKPYEEQAAEQKRGYADAVHAWNEATERWDQEAASLRASYEKENPFSAAKMGDFDRELLHKHRRTRNISYAEDRESDVGF
ncbi:Sec1-like protein [Fusarium tricinctum]|uniref:Sec1-like protein n=1 Tax=Fusarium tricinctum TaxID=61284 RepID=A0A8K0WDT8_9HYPO|nr:Sec1-like protein [Fusarium tricinctum]